MQILTNPHNGQRFDVANTCIADTSLSFEHGAANLIFWVDQFMSAGDPAASIARDLFDAIFSDETPEIAGEYWDELLDALSVSLSALNPQLPNVYVYADGEAAGVFIEVEHD